jgi:hydroxyacylglutathione hydrolase
LQFIQLPAFNDNYIWLIEKLGHVWVVDPGDATVVRNFLEKHSLHLDGLLITHHHRDHIGGVCELRDWAIDSGMESPIIYGPSQEEIPFKTHSFSGGEVIDILNGVLLQVIDVGGHTKGHIAYYLENANPPRLFCGDTLFASGCGRIFEGTANQLFDSLQRLAILPTETLVCCAHEYTLSNIRFAKAIEPNNQELINWSNRAESLRSEEKFTVPTTIGLELSVNPFLRCHEASVMKAASSHAGHTIKEPKEVFSIIRGWKDVFK